MKQTETEDDAFTFVETIAVIAVMLILAAGTGSAAGKIIERAKTAAASAQIDVYKIALHSYYLDCGVYPSSAQGLEALWHKPLLSPVPSNWRGPYVDSEIKKDPWGFSFSYKREQADGLPFAVISFGADGKEGGEAHNADIFSWK